MCFALEMSAPRNRARFDAAREDRESIRAILELYTQAQPPLRAKTILRMLEWPDERLCTVRRHLRAIRASR